jgi:hypothetical protein
MSGKLRVVVLVLVVLAIVGGGIGLVAAKGQDARRDDPEAVVNNFYKAYLDEVGAGESRRNLLVDGDYRDLPGLHPDCVTMVDELLASFAAEVPGGYDPFLQAQDVPEAIYTEPAIVEGDRAYVPVTTSFAGHRFLVTLTREDGNWMILRITQRPEQTVANFYGWYTHLDENPLVSGAYTDRQDLSPAFIAEIAATLASFADSETPGGYDPILLAQDVPVEVRPQAAQFTKDGATVTVEMIWGGNPTPTLRTVELVLGPIGWQIDGIAAE